MRRPSRRTWLAAAAGACTVAAVCLVLVHRGARDVLYTYDLSGPPAPVLLTTGTHYHIAIQSDHCPEAAWLAPTRGSDTDPRSIWFLDESATSRVVRHVDQDFQVVVTGTYRLQTAANLGTAPDPGHPCQFTATITKS